MNLFKFLTDATRLRKKAEPVKELARICITQDGTQYSFVEKKINGGISDGGIRMGIRIHSGPYRGVIFTTSPQISLTEQDDGTCRMNFSFTVEKLPENLPDTAHKDIALRDTVGNIIQDVLVRDWGGDSEEEQQEYADRGSNPSGVSE